MTILGYGETGATDGEEEEDLSWDVDEEKEEEKEATEPEEPLAPSEIVAEDAKPSETLTSTRSIEVPVVASIEGKILFNFTSTSYISVSFT